MSLQVGIQALYDVVRAVLPSIRNQAPTESAKHNSRTDAGMVNYSHADKGLRASRQRGMRDLFL